MNNCICLGMFGTNHSDACNAWRAHEVGREHGRVIAMENHRREPTPSETLAANLGTEPEGVGTVRVTYTDDKMRDFPNVRYEANRMEFGFLTMETDDFDTRVYHVPNVAFWEVVYI